MAVRNLVVSALIFFALVGMAAASSAEAPAAASDAGEVSDGSDHDLIGTVDDDGDDAAPVGAPVSEGTFPKTPSSGTSSDASSFKATAGRLGATVVAVTAASFLF